MIEIEIFSHSNINDNTISFERGDLKIINVSDAEKISEEDFSVIYDVLIHMETDKLIRDVWYSLKLTRHYDNDYTPEYWFEITDIETIN